MSYVVMDSRINNVQSLLEKILSAGRRSRKFIIKHLSNKEVKLICEVCLNLIRGNLRVTDPTAYSQLKRGRKALTDLADKRKPLKHKRRILNQKGGFLGAVAAAALPLLAQGISRIIHRK